MITINDTHTHTHTPNSVGLLWMSDQSVTETSTLQHTTFTTDIHAHSPSRRAAADQRLRPRGHWDRPNLNTFLLNSRGDLVITRRRIKYLVRKLINAYSEFDFIFWNNRTLNFYKSTNRHFVYRRNIITGVLS